MKKEITFDGKSGNIRFNGHEMVGAK